MECGFSLGFIKITRFIHKDVKFLTPSLSIVYAFLNFKIFKLIGTSKLDIIPKFYIIKIGHVVYFIEALSSKLSF